MDLISVDGHVIRPQTRVDKNGPDVEFLPIGRNNATIFTGFCGEHDTALFRVLDTEPFNPKSAEWLFQLAYRSVSRELHTVMEGGAKIQSAYQDRIDRGLEDPNNPSPAGMMATGHLIKAYETYQYRSKYFDEPLATGNLDSVIHDIIVLTDQPPNLAVSSLFSLPNMLRNGDLVRCVLNIFPTSADQTVVVFSYGSEDAAISRPALDRIISSTGFYQKYELSKLILGRVENFILSPKHFNAWSTSKRSTIKSAFVETIMNEEMPSDNPDLMLF